MLEGELSASSGDDLSHRRGVFVRPLAIDLHAGTVDGDAPPSAPHGTTQG